jgi:hypothetical protein
MTYNAVVTAAADEAGGQGFVTELAESTATRALAQQLLPESGGIAQFRQTADNLEPAELIARMVETFSSFATGNFGGPFASRPSGARVALDGVADVLAANLTLPPGVTVDDVLASPRCYFAAFRKPGMFYCDGKVAPTVAIDLTSFDKLKFLQAVETLVAKPLESTAALFAQQPYVTRLYTTMSAGEMTMDPEFDLNSEVGDVSNVHTVTLKYTNTNSCGDPSGPWEADVGGLVVRGMGNMWPITLSNPQKMPYNRRVLRITASGPPEVVADNTTVIAKALGGSQPAAAGDGGCTMGSGEVPSAAWLWAALAPLALWWRRRRRVG